MLKKQLLALSLLSLSCHLYSFDPKTTEINLITVHKGPSLEARFGHTILHLIDSHSKKEKLYDWGIFSFDDPYLAISFFQGTARYTVGEHQLQKMLYYYKYYHHRQVSLNPLLLTLEQKSTLISKLQYKLPPKMNSFVYDAFRKNCATIPRDLIDDALDGHIYQVLTAQTSPYTKRDLIHLHSNRPIIIGWFLDLILNETTDIPLNKWQESFGPLYLQHNLTTVTNPKTNFKPLLGPTVILAAVPDSPSHSLHFGFLIFIFFLILSIPCLTSPTVQGLYQTLAFFCYLALLGSWGILSTLLSLVLMAGTLITSQDILYYNLNLFFFWPTDILFFLSIFFLKRPLAPHLIYKMLNIYLLFHLMIAALQICFYLLSWTKQNQLQSILYLVPIHLLVYLSTRMMHKQRLIP